MSTPTPRRFCLSDTADHPSSTATPHHLAASPPRLVPKGATVAMRDGASASLVTSFGPNFPAELPLRGELYMRFARRLETVTFEVGFAAEHVRGGNMMDIGAAKS